MKKNSPILCKLELSWNVLYHPHFDNLIDAPGRLDLMVMIDKLSLYLHYDHDHLLIVQKDTLIFCQRSITSEIIGLLLSWCGEYDHRANQQHSTIHNHTPLIQLSYSTIFFSSIVINIFKKKIQYNKINKYTITVVFVEN